jgi:hypothetical protein
MPDVPINGSPTRLSGFTDATISNGTATPIPARRTALNGRGPQIITRLQAWASGRGATRTITLKLGSAQVALSRVAKSEAEDTGYRNVTTPWFISNGRTGENFQISSTGSYYFGRNTNLSGNIVNFGTSPNGQITFGYTYIESPTAPGRPSAVSQAAGQILVSWTAPSSNGGSAVNGYTLQYSTTENFSSGNVTVNAGNNLSRSVTGLTAGTTYYFRVAARNAVTDAASTTSVWSTSRARTVPTAPRSLAVSDPASARVTVTWTAPSTVGGTLQGYTLQYANNSSFSSATTVNLGNVTTYTSPELAYNGTFWFRVRAVHSNGVGPYSGSVSRRIISRRFSGSSFVRLTTAQRWTGSAWTNITIARRWTGSSWQNLS